MLAGSGHVVLANPVKTRQITGTMDIDEVNAKTLAHLLRTGYLPEVYILKEVHSQVGKTFHSVNHHSIDQTPSCLRTGIP